MENLFYFLNITVSVKCETAIHLTAVVTCSLKIYHTLQYSDILRIFFFIAAFDATCPMILVVPLQDKLQRCCLTPPRNSLHVAAIAKSAKLQKNIVRCSFSGALHQVIFDELCVNKIVRNISLKVSWCNSTENINLLAEMTLVYSTDLLTRSCRLILYGSVGLTMSKISS